MNVHKLKFDTAGNVEDITFVLAHRNGNKISNITNITDIKTKHAMNNYSEFSFTAHKRIDNNLLRCWDKLVDFKLTWIPEWDMWFEIYIELNDSDETIKSVTGKTIGEAELSQIMLFNIEINTETDISRDEYEIPTTFYNPDHPEASLVDRLMEKAPHYRFIHIDKSLMDVQRTYTFDGISIYDAFQEIAKEMDCLFVFHCGSDENGKPARTISVYDLEANCHDCGYRNTFVDECPKCGSKNVTNGYGEYTNVFVSKENLATEIVYSTDTDSVKNCFKLEAGDELMNAAIRSCNPNGTDYAYYFNDKTRAEMSDELQVKLKEYDTLYADYQTTYNFVLDASFVTNYNNIVDKYLKYDDSLAKIESSFTGYPKLMKNYFDTIDMVMFLKNKLMPNIEKPENSAKAQGEYLMQNLPSSAATTSTQNLTVSTANNIMITLVQSIVKGSFKITISDSTLSNDVWRGKFNLKNYSDEEDTYTSPFVSISINENYQEYIKQRLDKLLNSEDDNYYDIVGLFNLDLTTFKSELKKYCLDSLNTFQKCCQSCLDIMIQQGVASESSTFRDTSGIYRDLYVPYYNKLNAIQDEILVRESEIATIEGRYNNQNELVQDGVQIEIERIISQVQDNLNFEKFIGEELHKEFCSFIRMDKYSNSNYISDGLNNAELFENALDFLSVAQKEIYKSSTLQHSISGTLKNLLRMKEFEPIVDYFKNGNWICIQVDDEVYQLRIIEYTIDFSDTQNIDVVFSDVLSLADGISDLKSILESAEKMGTSYNGIVRQSEINSTFRRNMSEMITKGLDMTNTKIVSSADNQVITWDEHGILCRERNDILNDYNLCQLKVITHGMYLTTDGWKTAKAGVGRFYYFDPKDKTYKEGYGIIADTLVGNLILSSEVGIYNEEKSIEMNENGIIVTTNTYKKNVFTIQRELTDDKGNVTYERQLYIDDNGNIVLGGGSKISWDNVIGGSDYVDSAIGKIKEDISNFVKEVTGDMENLQTQIDGNITTWFYDYEPTAFNIPASDWTTTDLKNQHLGDLFYIVNNDKKNGICYRYALVDGEYKWIIVEDAELAKALADAAKAQDIADKKRRVFVTTPKPPYDVGDLWTQGQDGDLLRCIIAKVSTELYDKSDWVLASKYTDDTTANKALDKIDDLASDYTALKNILGYNGTTITGTYIYSPHIIGGDISIGTAESGVQAQITSDGKLVATGAEISGNITATGGSFRGAIYATSLTLGAGVTIDYGNISNAPYIPDTSLFIQKDGTIGSTPSDGTTGFMVSSSGLLKASNAIIYGTIYVSSGKIGGLILASNSISSINNNFSVTSGGILTAVDADITGTINATTIDAKEEYRIYAGAKSSSIPIIWINSFATTTGGLTDIYTGIQNKCFTYYEEYTNSTTDFDRQCIIQSQYQIMEYQSRVMCRTTQNSSYVEFLAQKDNIAYVHLEIANDGVPCFIPGSAVDELNLQDETIKLGTTHHKWLQVYAKNIYASGAIGSSNTRVPILYVDKIQFADSTSMSTASGGDGSVSLKIDGTVRSSNLTNYNLATQGWVTGLGYATQTWVGQQGYLTSHQSLSSCVRTTVTNESFTMKNNNGLRCCTNVSSNDYVGICYIDDDNNTILAFNKTSSGTQANITVLRGNSFKLSSTSGATITSDERLKSDFKNLSDYEDFFMGLETFAFKYKNGNSGRYHIGYKSQQVLNSLNESKLSSNDFGGYVELKISPSLYEGEKYIPDFNIECDLIYTEFIALNTHMIQKAYRRIDELELKILQLQDEITILKQK